MTHKVISIYISSVPSKLELTIQCDKCSYIQNIPAQVNATFSCYCHIGPKQVLWKLKSIIPFEVEDITDWYPYGDEERRW